MKYALRLIALIGLLPGCAYASNMGNLEATISIWLLGTPVALLYSFFVYKHYKRLEDPELPPSLKFIFALFTSMAIVVALGVLGYFF